MTTKTTPNGRIEREARPRWIALDDLKVNPLAQRELNPARVDRLAADFDLEGMGTITVNVREGSSWIIDGQHRVEALRAVGFVDEKIQCSAYEGLTIEEEAERFLQLNDNLAVPAIPKYRAAITAGRQDECDIDRIVRAAGLCVSKDKIPGAIGAVGTLQRIYGRSDPKTLRRTLVIARDAYGDPGMEAAVLDGLGLLCQRYNGDLDDEQARAKLAGAHGGVNALLGKAEVLRRQTGNSKNHCVAAAAVEIINAGRGGKKLPSWWKADA